MSKKTYIYLGKLALLLSYICIFSLSVGAESQVEDSWSNPSSIAIKRVSALISAQHEPNLLNNLDCTLLDYRLVGQSDAQTGCFTDTAFGMIDSDSDTVIYNGSDEGIPLLAFSSHEFLAPWPSALNLVSLDTASNGGSYVGLYKNPLASTKDNRNIFLKLTSKQLTSAADINITAPDGQRLIINPQSLAFSDGGSWLVAESYSGSFVRINLASLDIKPFAHSYGSQGSPALLKSRVAVSSNGRYVAIYNEDAAQFKVYDLETCSGTTHNLIPLNCKSHDYQSFIKSKIAGLSSVRHVRFINETLLSFEAQTSSTTESGIYEFAPRDTIDSMIDYLGLGDSYTSGEGAYDYRSGTDQSDNMCHLSSRSYPMLLARDLFSQTGGHSVACSGAVINDIASTNMSYRGQVKAGAKYEDLQKTQSALLDTVMTNFIPGYVAQNRFLAQYQPGITTVSVGGDDIGFGDILQKCVTPHMGRHISDGDCYNTFEDRKEVTNLVDRTKPKWVALFKQLQVQSPVTKLYAIGYPSVGNDQGNCATDVLLSKNELEFAEELIDYLNRAIAESAKKANVTYVDISDALLGHRLCETRSYDVAVNGLTSGKDAGVFGINILGKESYHPNALGQDLIEQAILKQTHNLTTASVIKLGSLGSKILEAPKIGRTLYSVIPQHVTSTLIRPARVASISVEGAQNGLKTNSLYQIKIGGVSGAVIGEATTDQYADLTVTLMAPPNLSPGGSTIDIVGTNQTDQPIDITQPIYIPVSDMDSDGDGQNDNNDSCPWAINSGEDQDRDGIDDKCDGFIGLSVNPPSSSNLITAIPIFSSTKSNPSLGLGAIGVTINPQQSKQISPAKPIMSSNIPRARRNNVNTTNTVAPSRLQMRASNVVYQAPAGNIHTTKIINWLPWIIIPLVCWWLIILFLWAVIRLIDEEKAGTKRGEFRLQ